LVQEHAKRVIQDAQEMISVTPSAPTRTQP
jgi:hypothetical protein